jgi:DNA-directed RNA polymerase subunit RPC12/RpoP
MGKPVGPPATIDVAWCATCKNIVMAYADSEDPPRNCPYCRHGYGRVRIVKYLRMERPET